MSAPLTLTTTHRSLERDADDLRLAADAYTAFVERVEPGLVALTVTADTDEATVTFDHVFADAAAAEQHLTTAADHIADSFAIAETTRIEVVGRPGPRITGLLDANWAAGVAVRSRESVNGFHRH